MTASDGSWANAAGATFTRQWHRCDAAGAGCADIGGATAGSYRVTLADVGRTIRIVVTATDGSSSASATSAATGVVAEPPEALNGRIAYRAPDAPDPTAWGPITSASPDGTGARQLVSSEPVFAVDPNWSPTGDFIAFSGRAPSRDPPDWVYRGAGSGIYLVGASGGAPSRISPMWPEQLQSCDYYPSVSPDGDRIVFNHSDPVEGNWNTCAGTAIWVMNADGSGRRSLGVNGGAPDWSPDGRIAFPGNGGIPGNAGINVRLSGHDRR